MLLHIVFS